MCVQFHCCLKQFLMLADPILYFLFALSMHSTILIMFPLRTITELIFANRWQCYRTSGGYMGRKLCTQEVPRNRKIARKMVTRSPEATSLQDHLFVCFYGVQNVDFFSIFLTDRFLIFMAN